LVLANIAETDQVAHLLEQEVLRSFSQPFRVDGTEIHLTVQVGIALYPSDALDVDTLYKNADIALKRAQGKGEPYLLYDSAMNERIIRSVTMQAKLRKAIEKNELVVHYQPKVSTANRRILGLEALLRYTDPEFGIVLPGRFIALLEETGMIIEVGAWVMRRVAEDLRHWRRLGLDPPRVAVNVSPIQLRQKNFVQSLREMVEENPGQSDGIDIEITESAIMEEVKDNIPKLEAVREMGFRIAIDDFGTGYSSLSYLSQLPVNALKIDQSFIVEMTERPNSLAIVSAIISLAHSLELEVIAEGVEREDQAKLLRLLRCELIQGNLYSPPLPADEIIALLRQP
jgi:EAL domain-containing protein (putative c-di-GMP-specific phosphodiesterase class I)